MADFEKKNIFIVVTSLQSQHVAGFIATPWWPCFLIFSDSATKFKHTILGKVKGGGASPNSKSFYI